MDNMCVGFRVFRDFNGRFGSLSNQSDIPTGCAWP